MKKETYLSGKTLQTVVTKTTWGKTQHVVIIYKDGSTYSNFRKLNR